MYFLFLMFLLALFIFINSLSFPYRDARLVPVLASTVIMAMMLIEIIRKFRGQVKVLPGEEKAEAGNKDKGEWSKLARLMGWVGGLLVGIYVLGFMFAIPLFLLAYLKSQGRSWLIAVTFSVSITATIYVIFVIAAGIMFPAGLIFA